MTPADESLPSASDVERLGPWGAVAANERLISPPDPVVQSQQPSVVAQIGWGLVSTAILAAWLTYQGNWIFAAAGVLGVLVHELGHLAAINSLGCGPGRIHIIPFFGGAASMSRTPDTEFKGVLIALAGPIAGLTAAIPFYLLFASTKNSVWLDGVLFVGGLNLLNLVPAPPLDGSKALGPALSWIHPNVERGVMILLGALGAGWAVTHGQIFIAVFIGIGLAQAVMGRAPRPPAQRLSTGQWFTSIGLWLVALVLCAGVTWMGLSRNV